MKKGGRDIVFQLGDSQSQSRYGKNFGPMDRTIPFELSSWSQAEFMCKMSSLIMIFSMLMLIQSKWIGGVLIVVDAILPLLTQLKIIVDVSLHDHLLFGAQPWNFSLRVNYQYLAKKIKKDSIFFCQMHKSDQLCFNSFQFIIQSKLKYILWLHFWS